LGHRTIALTNLAALCLGCGIFMAYVPLAPVAQAPRSTGFGLGMSVAMAGIVLVPHGVVQILAGPWTGGACARFGCRVVLVAGATINALTTAWLAVMHGSVVGLMAAGAVLGLGQACALTAMATLTVEAVAPQDVGIATGINVVMRTIGMALGSALSSSILGASSHGLFASQQAYAAAFAVGAAITAGAVLCAIALRTGRGESQAAAMTGPAVVADRAA
jgi:predicted MFS family arabinose efflux permease